jgi:hypothetical protein
MMMNSRPDLFTGTTLKKFSETGSGRGGGDDDTIQCKCTAG